MEAINVGQLTYSFLKDMNSKLGQAMDGDCVFINCGMQTPLDDEFRVVIEELSDVKEPKKHLILMLETGGGHMETVERLVSVMRKHYKKVSFIIPNYAYSAGTVLALSGDAIYMDYYSVLGPIDPQYRDNDGKQLLPGMGYLAKFNELVAQINDVEKPSDAQLAYLVKNFDPARLFHIEQAVKHGISLITDWLPKYKFKDWNETKTKKSKVTPSTRKERAKEIAEVLGDAEKWHSHGRGIPMKELQSESIKLAIDDFGKDENLNQLIRNYHGLCVDYYSNMSGVRGYIHSLVGMRRVF